MVPRSIDRGEPPTQSALFCHGFVTAHPPTFRIVYAPSRTVGSTPSQERNPAVSLTITVVLGTILVLALFDLWVGVANDAVNFLNSAVGARVATRRTILLVAAIGVLFGALTSSGLMEVARRGVFDPDHFIDPNGLLMVEAILAVYLGVMAADVLLLDLFNTVGLPTSTTVSIISELVGASIAVALWATPGGIREAVGVIQTGPVLGIYTGIFLSVLVAFSVSALIMLAVRVLYTHDVARTFRSVGWVWTGASFAAITYFVLFKGLRGANLLSPELMDSLQANIHWFLIGVFAITAGAGIALRDRHEVVLKFIILCGTGALGLAFAGNDLVNFIGPSVAAAQAALVDGIQLSGRVQTPKWALIVAGVVMVVSLWTSEKARRVTDTEVRLAAHGGKEQRFEKAALAVALVRWSTTLFGVIRLLTPRSVRSMIDRRTRPPEVDGTAPPYDLLRASVNLTVASLLISIGTASGLPLSTTYITFMAAMGAAVGDRTWTTRDAEQRMTGILTVLGGWLVTGFIAAFGAFMMASMITLGGVGGVAAAVGVVAAGLWRMGNSKSRARHRVVGEAGA